MKRLRGAEEVEESQRIYEFALSARNCFPCIIIIIDLSLIYLLMRPLSPIRSTSPLPRPRITFNYPPSPLKERHQNLTPHSPYTPAVPYSPCHTISEPCLPLDDKCKNCPKQATYKEMENQKGRFCSNCAIVEMRNGNNVVRIQLKEQNFYKQFHQRSDKENMPRIHQRQYSTGQKTELKMGSLENLIKQTDVLKEDMQNILTKLEDKQFASEGIKAIYREKKIGLKNHYEKIKATIKMSIEKDLLQLENRQKASLQCLQEVKGELSSGIGSIQRIKQEYSKGEQISDTNFQMSTLTNHRKIASQIVEQLSAFQQGSEARSDSLHVKQTHEQLQQVRNQLYDPLNYTLLKENPHKQQTLFSFERRAQI